MIDDDAAIVDLLRMRLVAAGHEVEIAMDAYAAMIAANKFKPDLITLDYQMPAGDGADILNRLRQTTHTMRTPVIFITGTRPADLEYLRSHDANAHALTKPIDMAKLLGMIVSLVGPGKPPPAPPPAPPGAPLPPLRLPLEPEDNGPGEILDLDA